MTMPKHVFEIEIRTTPEALWQAITDPEFTHRYYHGTRVQSDWNVGSTYAYVADDGQNAIEGVVLEIDPPKRLVTTFSMMYRPDLAADRPSRVTWEIEPVGEICKLTVVHDDFDGETETFKTVGGGKRPILESMKALLETGVPLPL
ncbi:MAG: SRPBCC family protein [Actinomycetota bacterium]